MGLQKLFDNNAQWMQEKTAANPSYFRNLAREQDPDYLWIGCADSRVPANEIIGLEPGELFVHRNVANLVPHTDFNALSVLEFGVNILKVKHIIVCGHYRCGGINAAMQNHHSGLIDNWLRNIRDVYFKHQEELMAIDNIRRRSDRLVEFNIIAQVLNVCHTPIVQEAWARGQKLYVHGLVYDLETGRLKDLHCTHSSAQDVDAIYRVLANTQE